MSECLCHPRMPEVRCPVHGKGDYMGDDNLDLIPRSKQVVAAEDYDALEAKVRELEAELEGWRRAYPEPLKPVDLRGEA